MASEDDNKKITYIQERLDVVIEKTYEIGASLKSHREMFEQHSSQDEQMYDELRRMNNILQDNTNSLRQHMHRTDLLEILVKNAEARFNPFEVEMIRKKNINNWIYSRVLFLSKFGAVGSAIAGAAVLVKHLLHYLSS